MEKLKATNIQMEEGITHIDNPNIKIETKDYTLGGWLKSLFNNNEVINIAFKIPSYNMMFNGQICDLRLCDDVDAGGLKIEIKILPLGLIQQLTDTQLESMISNSKDEILKKAEIDKEIAEIYLDIIEGYDNIDILVTV